MNRLLLVLALAVLVAAASAKSHGPRQVGVKDGHGPKGNASQAGVDMMGAYVQAMLNATAVDIPAEYQKITEDFSASAANATSVQEMLASLNTLATKEGPFDAKMNEVLQHVMVVASYMHAGYEDKTSMCGLITKSMAELMGHLFNNTSVANMTASEMWTSFRLPNTIIALMNCINVNIQKFRNSVMAISPSSPPEEIVGAISKGLFSALQTGHQKEVLTHLIGYFNAHLAAEAHSATQQIASRSLEKLLKQLH